MLETYFSGKREMFEGLKIAELEKEWAVHPILHLDLNNLRDISMLKDYERICGITEEELHSVFKEGVKELGAANDMSEEETKAELKELYDGYHFNEDCVDIYNLSGLMITLDSKQLMSNWIEVGTPSFLVKMLKKRDSDFGDLEGVEIDGSLLDSNDTALSTSWGSRTSM